MQPVDEKLLGAGDGRRRVEDDFQMSAWWPVIGCTIFWVEKYIMVGWIWIGCGTSTVGSFIFVLFLFF